MAKRPKWLTFIGVVSIVIGASTTLGAISHVAQVKPSWLQPAAAPPPEGTGAARMAAAQAEFHRRTTEINDSHRGFFLTLLPFALLAAAAMIVGGATALKLRRWSRPLLLGGMAATLFIQLITARTELQIQSDMADATTTMMQKMFDGMDDVAHAGAARSVLATTAAMTRVANVAGLVTRAALIFAQIAFAIFGIIYLSRVQTRALFAAQASTPPATGS